MGAFADQPEQKPRGRRQASPPSEPLCDVGRIVGSFGLEGRLKVLPLTDFPERFDPGSVLLLRGRETEVLACSWHKGQPRIQLSGVHTVEQAEALVGEVLQIRIRDRARLRRGEFYDTDLIGLSVVSVDGRVLGTVSGIHHAPAQDLLQVGDALIPMVREFVKRVAIDQGTIEVDLIPGMEPGQQAEEIR